MGTSANDRLTDHQCEILAGEGIHSFPFQGATPGSTTPSSRESASAVWDLLVEETNRFAAQVQTSPSSRPGDKGLCTYNDGYGDL